MKRLFLLVVVLLACSAPALSAPRAVSAEETYALGLKQMNRGYHTKALEQFNRVRTFFRDDPYALKAELAIADIHFKRNEWDAARVAYEDFMRAHPRHKELDYVVFRLGMTLYKKAPVVAARDQTWTRQAVNAWSGFSARFPDSEYADEVQAHLQKARDRLARKELLVARFYDRREAWQAVVGRAESLLRRYPDSPDRFEALALLGEAYFGMGEPDLARGALDRLADEAPGSRHHRKLGRLLR